MSSLTHKNRRSRPEAVKLRHSCRERVRRRWEEIGGIIRVTGPASTADIAKMSEMLPLYRDPCFIFRFADDRIIPRFHLEGVQPGTQVSVFQIDRITGERRNVLATAMVGEGGWVDLDEPIVVRAGEAFVAVPSRGERRRENDKEADRMLIAMAGLPGTGKSAIAARLAAELRGVVLSKDEVRAALFPLPVLDHSTTENEISMAAIFNAARYIRTAFPQHPVIIDGRTFLRTSQVHALEALAESLGEKPRLIECVCAEDVARKRLEQDVVAGRHPAKNRDFALHLAVKETAEPIQTPHLVLDTGIMSLDECVQRCVEYLQGPANTVG